MNPFLYTPEEYAQRRMRHGGMLVAPAQFVPLDSARHIQSTRMKLRKKQLARAATDAVRDAEIARAISKAVRREKHARAMAAAHACAASVAVQHVVSTSDVIFATPEAAQLLCGDQDIEWVDVDDCSDGECVSADERAHRRRQKALRHRTRFARAKARRGLPRPHGTRAQHSTKMRR